MSQNSNNALLNHIESEIRRSQNLLLVYETAKRSYLTKFRELVMLQEQAKLVDQTKCDAEGIEF